MELEQLYEQAQQLVAQGKHDDAYKALKRLDAAAPNHPGILYLIAICQSKAGNKVNAIKTYRQVLKLMPNFVEAMNNLGLDLLDQKKPEDALPLFQTAAKIRPEFLEALVNQTTALIELMQYELAFQLLSQLEALPTVPNGVFQSFGSLYIATKNYKSAANYFEKALQENPSDVTNLFMYGSSLQALGKNLLALECYKKTLLIDPNHELANGRIIEMQLKLCDWPPNLETIASELIRNRKTIHPIAILYISDSAKLIQTGTSCYAGTGNQTFQPEIGSSSPIRVGYFSTDLREHAVSFLATGLFEQHDTNKFEVFTYSLSPDPFSNEWTDRIKEASSHYFSCGSMPDKDIIKLARDHKLDIAIDLNGHTNHARTQIFANRVAPIQIQYLGYPGTMGGAYFDYTIADDIVIPKKLQHFYTEKIIYLPECFQVNDNKREILATPRAELGLPESDLILACFSQASKITPAVFASWLHILLTVPNASLWLFDESPEQVNNLRQHAENAGIRSNRLIFGERLPYAQHLGRYQHADLVLDTFPFNGGTTTSDALWGGAPVLTICGEAYSSRMSASLLHSVGMDELVTYSIKDYETLAIKLLTSPQQLSALRKHLQANLCVAPVFDTRRFTQHFEAGLEMAVDRARKGLKPDHISVPQPIAPK